MKTIAIILAFIVGLLMPFQAIVNSRLAIEIGSSLMAALVSFTGGFVIFLIINLFSPGPIFSIKQLSEVPLYQLTGGIFGAIFIISAIFVLPKLGPTIWVGLIIAGQLTMSLILDHYGFMGVPINPINLYRVFGVIALALGSTLILKY